MQKPPLLRLQHSGFGEEFRRLQGSPIRSDKDLVGVLISELDDLAERKANGERHRREDRLEGSLSEVGYLRLYGQGRSTRMYFVVLDGVIWMLALDANKRQDGLGDGMARLLADRLREANAEAENRKRLLEQQRREEQGWPLKTLMR